MVNIEGLNKADVLATLYNNSKILGMGFLQSRDGIMTRDDAAALLKEHGCFDYLYGKVMKLDLLSDIEFDEWGYDRDNGEGKAQRLVDLLREMNQRSLGK